MKSILETHALPIFDSRVVLTEEKRAPRTDFEDTKYNLIFPRSGLSGNVRNGADEQSRATVARGSGERVSARASAGTHKRARTGSKNARSGRRAAKMVGVACARARPSTSIWRGMRAEGGSEAPTAAALREMSGVARFDGRG